MGLVKGLSTCPKHAAAIAVSTSDNLRLLFPLKDFQQIVRSTTAPQNKCLIWRGVSFLKAGREDWTCSLLAWTTPDGALALVRTSLPGHPERRTSQTICSADKRGLRTVAVLVMARACWSNSAGKPCVRVGSVSENELRNHREAVAEAGTRRHRRLLTDQSSMSRGLGPAGSNRSSWKKQRSQ